MQVVSWVCCQLGQHTYLTRGTSVGNTIAVRCIHHVNGALFGRCSGISQGVTQYGDSICSCYIVDSRGRSIICSVGEPRESSL